MPVAPLRRFVEEWVLPEDKGKIVGGQVASGQPAPSPITRHDGSPLSSGTADPGDRPGARSAASKVTDGDRDTGAALRSVYQKTVDEVVPDEMLDLLGRLD